MRSPHGSRPMLHSTGPILSKMHVSDGPANAKKPGSRSSYAIGDRVAWIRGVGTLSPTRVPGALPAFARGTSSLSARRLSLKLHFVINHKGQIMALKITPSNTADSTVLDEMTRHLAGKLYANKGYIGQDLFKTLWRRGLHLITSIRRNMRNYLMPMADKIMLRKRFVIETVLDTLKSEMGLEHSRHRSPVNAMIHVLSCLVAYAFRPGKPSISLNSKHLQAYP